jgi:DNA-binding HxlR family transcriptional regulator
MAGNRSYGDQCGVARSLDVIGERWALLVVRELLLGPKRFNDLLAGLPGASPNVISQRLRELTGDGVIRQRDLPPPARVRLYELTDWGRELEPVILHLGQWGDRAPLPDGAQAGLDSLLLAIQAAADPARVSGRYELRIGADTFAVDGSSGSVRIRRGGADHPEATATTDPGTFRTVIFGQRPIADVVAVGDLSLAGDPDATGRLTDLLLTLTAGRGQPQPAQTGSASG